MNGGPTAQKLATASWCWYDKLGVAGFVIATVLALVQLIAHIF